MNKEKAKQLSDDRLHKIVFCYDSSEADNRYFRQTISDYLKSNMHKSFTQTMYEAVWERNGGGKTLMYCYFDEYNQKVRLDNCFYEWMTRMAQKINTELDKIQHHE